MWVTRLGTFEVEGKAGAAYVIGYVDKTELKKNQTYSHCYRTFRRHHGMSAIANITTLVCYTMYLYYLNFVILNPIRQVQTFYPYQKDGCISSFRVVVWYFAFSSNFIYTYCKQTVKILVRRRNLRRLI